jgi:uncharacterized membrane protein
MRPPFYVRQLRLDLEEWIAKGLVPATSREAILESVGGRSGPSLVLMLAIFGVILIGAGAMSYVAANWPEMSKFARLVVLFGTMWAAFAAAILCFVSDRAFIGQAFVLLGVLMFGANIMLIAQTYNINSHWPDGTLMWGLGALAAAALVPSRAALAAAMALGALWTWQEWQYFDDALHVPFLFYWAACAALVAWFEWRPGVQLAALALTFWFVINVSGLQRILGWGDAETETLYIFVPLAVWSVMQALEEKANAFSRTIGHYAFFIFLIAYALLQMPDNGGRAVSSSWFAFAGLMSAISIGATAVALSRKGATIIDLLGAAFVCVTTIAYVMLVKKDDGSLDVLYLAFTLVTILWSLGRGVRNDDRFVINLSTVAFGLWVLYVYFVFFNGLMDQAVFFIVGGLLLILLSFALEPFRRRLIAGTKPAPAAPAATS